MGELMMTTVQREVSDRTPFGKLMKWLFIGFNVLMLVWMASSCVAVSDVTAGAINDAERAGAAIGAGIGMTFLLLIWGLGDVILGMFVLFTRRKKIITIEE
jgi:hypothetical protein